MVNTVNKENQSYSSGTKQMVIDADLHSYIDSLEELVPYSDEDLHRRLNIGKFQPPSYNGKIVPSGVFRFPESRYVHPNHVVRLDSHPPNGKLPGSDPEFTAKDLLEPTNVAYAILNSTNATMGAFHDTNLAKDFNKAYNDWQYENWVEKDSRYKTTMLVTPLDPDEAVKEIERIGKKPGVVAIDLQTSCVPLGKKHFYPIYEIAESYGLPIYIHPDSEGAGEYGPAQAVGPASTYMEWHTTLGLNAMRNITSLVCEGVFERFPNLKVVFAEYGFSWIGSLMWRLDKNWKALRSEVPWLKERPSNYIRKNVRLGTQPIEEPFRPKDLLEIVQMSKAEDMLLYSSDYPHWDGDEVDRIFGQFPKELKSKIFYENAWDVFPLEK